MLVAYYHPTDMELLKQRDKWRFLADVLISLKRSVSQGDKKNSKSFIKGGFKLTVWLATVLMSNLKNNLYIIFGVSWSHVDTLTLFLPLCLPTPLSGRKTMKGVKEQATSAQVTQQRHLSAIAGASVGPQPGR